jgi:hypothetical protein
VATFDKGIFSCGLPAGQNVNLVNVKPGGMQSDFWALEDLLLKCTAACVQLYSLDCR